MRGRPASCENGCSPKGVRLTSQFNLIFLVDLRADPHTLLFSSILSWTRVVGLQEPIRAGGVEGAPGKMPLIAV